MEVEFCVVAFIDMTTGVSGFYSSLLETGFFIIILLGLGLLGIIQGP